MADFSVRKISASETVGEKLRQHRESAGYTINQAARKMNLNPRYLKWIENDEFDKLPSGVYVKKIIGHYATFLSLNPETVFNLFDEQKDLFEKLHRSTKSKDAPDNWFQKIIKFILSPTTLRYAIFSVIIFAVLAYIGTGVKKIFTPPELIIKNPVQESIITTERSLRLEGITEREVELTINGKQLLCDQNGNFIVDLDLQTGMNMITVSAKKKHSQPRVIYRQIIVAD
jgi:cytoskeletal protein RodZ